MGSTYPTIDKEKHHEINRYTLIYNIDDITQYIKLYIT